MRTFTSQTIDLHIHSNCSDGAFSPEELIKRAHTSGLCAIAIADHDSVSGLPEALTAAATHGIELIPAVELSVQYQNWQDVHLLGYGMDYLDSAFVAKLSGFRDRRSNRTTEILERINQRLESEGRPPLMSDEVTRYARDTIGRPHIARALMMRGYVTTMEDAFQQYLIPCNVPKYYWPIADAIHEIKRLGGVAVLAHPTTLTTDREMLRTIILEMKQLGVDGIEVYNNLVHPHEMEFLRRRTTEAGLLITAGSDFHGIESGLELGRGRGGISFSAELLIPLKELIRARHKMCAGHTPPL